SVNRTTTCSLTSSAPWASMALVHASDTASFRSSMRSSASTRRVEATDETTRRTSATNSARAGISSSSTWSTRQLAGDSGVDGVVNGEHLGKAGDLEDLQDAVLRADEGEITVVTAQPLQTADQ